MYDNIKYPCINDWLNQEHQEHEFKVGDFVRVNGVDSGIGVVIDVKDKVYYKFIDRYGKFNTWEFGDHRLYHKSERDVYIMINESNYEKIF